MKNLGLDIGSTTLKCVLTDEEGKILFSAYERHYSQIRRRLGEMLAGLCERFPGERVSAAISGSAGMGMADALGLAFVQEVYAEQIAVKRLNPGTDAVIELGGEDAKILFLTGGFEMRMNGSCAGGTGAFIDQMAALMNTDAAGLDALAGAHERVCTIASRCGVFAKSDVQPLLNQGVPRADIAAGIFRAVVNQTVAGLAQGRKIGGQVLYLGGPLTFLPQLRASFDEVLGVDGLCPADSLYYVALGAAFAGVGREMTIEELGELVGAAAPQAAYNRCAPLFTSQEEYDAFAARHKRASEGIRELSAPTGRMFLGIDAGSTTIKLVLCDERGNLFRPFYSPNNGNPIPFVREYLQRLYADWPGIEIGGAAVTGYGEQIVKNAFHADLGLVETIAHYTAAKRFRADVDFILDIGGQDIKCFRVRNGAIDDLFLNEACSSGCGSFLQTFAGALGYTSEEFARLGLFADAPVDLGSRCTVFMNSAVKQAQKDGASIKNIAAGLSVSVVKNALYKVIRCASADALGQNIVVQGGTFLNDCVLRAFEQELGREVIRPAYAPLMGAYGAALYAMEHVHAEKSGILSAKELDAFTHTTKNVVCQGCGNHCNLTVNSFSGTRRYIAGNRCSKPVGGKGTESDLNIYDYKLKRLSRYMENRREASRVTVGLPLGLNMYELLPFWHGFFTALGFNVLVSPLSDRELYLAGQGTIPSDTACYPAKLMHGHIAALMRETPDAIFYPDMSYNVDEGLGVDHYNCPVVAYYPQVLKMNVPELRECDFICDFVSLADKKQFKKRMKAIMDAHFAPFSRADIDAAAERAYAEYAEYLGDVRAESARIMAAARERRMPVIVLAGRPYHIDPEINHGIDRLVCSLGAAVVSEDCVSALEAAFPTKVRNQWTYHSRLYAAAKYVADAPREAKINLVQLVSFGCGVDAVTTDEVRAIIEGAGKIYTQLKIDEISNMGAVTIRLRSLFEITKTEEAGT